MPRQQKIEKSKDFKGSIKKLIISLKEYHLSIIISLILAMFSAILSLISPNKLSELADYITECLKPNSEKISEITTIIYQNGISNFYNAYKDNDHLTELEKEMLDAILTEEKTDDYIVFSKLNNDTLSNVLKDVVIDNTNITVADQLKFFTIIRNSSDKDNKGEENLKELDKLPTSIYSLITPNINMQKVKKVSLFIAIIFLLSALFNYFEQIIMAICGNKYGYGIRKQIDSKINSLPLKYFDNHETGDILSRITNDVDTVWMNLSHNLSSLVANSTMILGSVIMMFITNWIMAMAGIIASLIGFAFMFILLSKSQKYFVARQEQLGDLNGYIEEIYSAHNIVLAYNGEKETNNEFDKLNAKLFESSRKSQFLSGIMQPLMGFVGNLGYVAVCITGALLVMNGKISFGVIVAFMIYVRMFTRPLSQIAQSMTSVQSTAAAAERVFDFLEETEMSKEDDIRSHLDKSKVKGNIEFKNVHFGYEYNKPIIKNFSAQAKSGQKIAIVGPTGAGKTTIVNLLMKFYEITDGDILIDGVSTKKLSRANIHELFCMVLQDTWLFDGSIGDNIRFNKENVTDAEIWSACRTVGIDHFIKTLPNGLDAGVGDNEAISQGQKQLITIARGMIKDAPFLILDEATSNVDTRTEELVQKAMDKLTEGRTSFIIAHRLSTIKNADLILVMKDGNIVEQGCHEELLRQNGFYAKLYNSQFEL